MSGLVDTYPLVISQDVIWRDMDAFLHVNNAVYFRYFEDIRMKFFEDTGIIRLKDETGVGPILGSTRCDFRAPLEFPDRIQVGTVVEDIQAKRFTMKYVVWSEGQNRVAAEGEGLLVYFDYAAGRSCEIPDVVREAIAKLVGAGNAREDS